MSNVLPRITKAMMREDNLIDACNKLTTERNRARAHAEALAEALRESSEAMTYASSLSSDVQTYLRVTIKKARHALAAYEKAKA